MQIPLVDITVERPSRGSVAWYGTLGAMTALGVLEWPVAAVVATGHLLAQNTRSEAVAGAAEGAESAAS